MNGREIQLCENKIQPESVGFQFALMREATPK